MKTRLANWSSTVLCSFHKTPVHLQNYHEKKFRIPSIDPPTPPYVIEWIIQWRKSCKIPTISNILTSHGVQFWNWAGDSRISAHFSNSNFQQLNSRTAKIPTLNMCMHVCACIYGCLYNIHVCVAGTTLCENQALNQTTDRPTMCVCACVCVCVCCVQMCVCVCVCVYMRAC